MTSERVNSWFRNGGIYCALIVCEMHHKEYPVMLDSNQRCTDRLLTRFSERKQNQRCDNFRKWSIPQPHALHLRMHQCKPEAILKKAVLLYMCTPARASADLLGNHLLHYRQLSTCWSIFTCSSSMRFTWLTNPQPFADHSYSWKWPPSHIVILDPLWNGEY